MLTHEIRSSLDRHTILRTTIGELARTLQLEECMLWMPQRSGADLQLTHQLHPPSSLVPITLAMNDPTVQEVMQSGGAIEISPVSHSV
jgi:ethylene receptor